MTKMSNLFSQIWLIACIAVPIFYILCCYKYELIDIINYGNGHKLWLAKSFTVKRFNFGKSYLFKDCSLDQLNCPKKKVGLPLNIDKDLLDNMDFPLEKEKVITLSAKTVKDFVFVTASSDTHIDESLDGIATVQMAFPNRSIIYYDIGLSEENAAKVKHLCNVEVRKFNFSRYPAHVRNLKEYAWKPLIIYEVLLQNTGIFWIDACIRFLHSSQTKTTANFDKLFHYVIKNGGMALFTQVFHSNFAVAHPSMYKYIPTDIEKQKTVSQYEANAMLIYRTESVYKNVIHWLTLCALEKQCIAPEGANVDCDFTNRNPFTDYIECHRYDQVAVNMFLQNYFKFQSSRFVSPVIFHETIRDSSKQFKEKYCYN